MHRLTRKVRNRVEARYLNIMYGGQIVDVRRTALNMRRNSTVTSYREKGRKEREKERQ